MALTFPSSPTDGQVYTDTDTGNRYIYDLTKGLWKVAANTVAMSVSSTPPANVATGSLWFNREIGRTFVYYDDGDSVQWIETVPSGSIDTNTIAAYTGPIYNTLNSCYTSTNTSYIFANLAITTANTAFPNTPNVSYNGSFYVPNGSITIGTNSYPVGKFHVSTANGEIARFTATGASGGYNVLFIDNSTPWYFGSAKATIAGNLNDLYLGSGYGTTNNLIFGVAASEKVRIGTANNITITSNVYPALSNTFDLGSSTARWRNIYTGDLHLANEFGNWTIVEGEDELFLYNNKKDKVYKFNLTEVDPATAPPKKGV